MFREDEPEAPALMDLLAGETVMLAGASAGTKGDEGLGEEAMTPEEIVEQENLLSMYGVFRRYDKDDSGHLDQKELWKCLNHIGVKVTCVTRDSNSAYHPSCFV